MAQFTKMALANSLKTMVKTKPLNKIKVTDLVEACGVNRQTFYYHFQDIYGLLGWIYETEALALIENHKSYTTWQEGLYIILEYVSENKEFCINTYKSLGREHLEQFLEDVLCKLLGDVVDEIGENTPISDENKDFLIKFYSYAFLGTLLEWIRTELKSPPQTIAKNIGMVMDGTISLAIQRLQSN